MTMIVDDLPIYWPEQDVDGTESLLNALDNAREGVWSEFTIERLAYPDARLAAPEFSQIALSYLPDLIDSQEERVLREAVKSDMDAYMESLRPQKKTPDPNRPGPWLEAARRHRSNKYSKRMH
jgi:hypothetical protein